MPLSHAETVPALLREQASLGEHAAVIDHGVRISYAGLYERVRDVGRAFIAAGVGHGDRVAVWLPNRHEFILAMLGAQAIGAAVVPLNTRYTGHEAAYILSRSRARVIVLDDAFLAKGFVQMLRRGGQSLVGGDGVPSPADGQPAPGLPALRLAVSLDGSHGPGTASWGEFLARGRAVGDDALEARMEAVTRDDMIDMLFTSGTTGAPKGVIALHRQSLSIARSWSEGAELTRDDVYGIVNPMFHGFGYKAGLLSSLIAGCTIIPISVFEPEALMQLVEAERISVLPGVPTIFTTLLDHPRRRDYDLSSLRFAVAGATTAPPTLFHDMVDVLGFDRVAQAYGLTECLVATFSRHGESLDHASQTTGPAVPGLEIRVVDEHGRDTPTDQPGEILLRGDIVFTGYFEDAAATAAAFDGEGWFHTGDVGSLDEHGCLKITDRIKDMFIVGGFNVYPAEVEHVLRGHPAVNESAVLGIPDDRLGTVGRAYVKLLTDAQKPSAQELAEFCRERLANFKVPREFVFVDDFPRNATGKILKRELRDES
ncbi:AMP-binding protein [Microbacterium luticocti]|uniref:AMP-binding protein n=1 Tax=Microbacterium luticocti TaxID=451764 RepID=UPI00040FB3E5|nr:AMP-binding protein [Microbacterium luticocti]